MKIIGKKRAGDLLRKRFPKLNIDDSLYTVFKKFDKTDLNILPVFKGKKFVGEVHEIDLLKVIVNPDKLLRRDIIQFRFSVDFGYFAKKAADIMTRHELSIKEKDLVEDAAYVMLKEGVRCMPVFRKKKLIGILTEVDLINKIVKKGLLKKWNS